MKKVILTCLVKPDKKLLFVKIIKMVSGLGLKEAKDIADFLFSNINTPVELELVDDLQKTDGLSSVDYLHKNIPNCGGEIKVIGGKNWQREYKMLTLGLGEESDYVNFILDSFYKKDVLEEALKKLDKQQLIDLLNKIEI